MKGPIARTISRNIGGTKICLALAIAGRIAGRIREELNSKLRVGSAVQRALNGCVIGIRAGRSQHRKVLQFIRTGVGVAGIVWRDAGRLQIDSQSTIRIDRV